MPPVYLNVVAEARSGATLRMTTPVHLQASGTNHTSSSGTLVDLPHRRLRVVRRSEPLDRTEMWSAGLVGVAVHNPMHVSILIGLLVGLLIGYVPQRVRLRR
jgi:hypothetical protein